jgi:O-antigen/teichoic acid export membrane protein
MPRLRVNLRHPDKYFAFGGNVTRSLARLIISVLFARLAGQEAYAGFVIFVAIEVIACSIVNSLVVAPMMTIAPGLAEPERSALHARACRRTGIWSLSAGAMCLLAVPMLSSLVTSPAVAVAFAASTAAWCACQGPRGWRQSSFGSRRSCGADLIGLSVPIPVVLAAGLLKLDVSMAFWSASAVGGVLSLLIHGWPKTGRNTPLPASLELRYRRMGMHMTVGTVANTLCSRIQPFVLALAANAGVVALFGAASVIVGPLRLLSMSLAGVLRPRFALHFGRGRPDEVQRIVALSATAVSATGAMAILSIAVLGEWPIVAVFGESFRGVARIAPWACLFATLEAIGTILVVLVQAASDHGPALATRLRTAATVLALLLMWPACSAFGASGAFAAAAVVELVFVGMLLRRAARDQLLTAAPVTVLN